jgi:protein gp37
MAENSGIAWTDNTLNPWVGCTKVSPACDNCYAERLVEGRLKGDFSQRRRTVPSTWNKARAWDRKAAAAGTRTKVFCASLADWMDNQVPIEWLVDLLDLIRTTPALDWQLLTKRPQNVRKRLEAAMLHVVGEGTHMARYGWLRAWLSGSPPANIWLGTTVENQAEAERRIPHLLEVPARVHFLSCEPLLGRVDLRSLALGNGVFLDAMTGHHHCSMKAAAGGDLRGALGDMPILPSPKPPIGWVITGGESGPGAREADPEWYRVLRDECQLNGVPFFMKQMSAASQRAMPPIPDDLMVREFPVA